MSPAPILLRKSILNFRRAKAALVVTFLVPVLLIVLFGFVFGLYGQKSDPAGIPVARRTLTSGESEKASCGCNSQDRQFPHHGHPFQSRRLFGEWSKSRQACSISERDFL